MIEVNVAKYCQDCPEFEPYCERQTSDLDGVNTYVCCAHDRRCRAIAQSILERLRKELGAKLDN
jgi:hypothetical protein